jgi:hypothetical protein
VIITPPISPSGVAAHLHGVHIAWVVSNAAVGHDTTTGVSGCVEMYQNGQDESVAFFWHRICRVARLGDSEPFAMERDTKKTDQKGMAFS